MPTKFSAVKTGSFFKADGTDYKKVDDLWYEDHMGTQEMWNPMFDQTIGEDSAPQREIRVELLTANEEPEFITDPQSRVQRRNPKYKKPGSQAETAMAMITDSNFVWSDPQDYIKVAEEVLHLFAELQQLRVETGKTLRRLKAKPKAKK